jgi:hypothetical protein
MNNSRREFLSGAAGASLAGIATAAGATTGTAPAHGKSLCNLA